MPHPATDPAARTLTRRARAAAHTRAGGGIMVILLLIQYVLGLSYNLFGPAPTPAHPLQMFSNPQLGAHSALGILVVLGSIDMLAAGIRTHRALPLAAVIVGILSILGAFTAGTMFLPAGSDATSMTMGTLTALAILCYTTVLWAPARTPARPAA